MPELPEVETIRRRLQCGSDRQPSLVGRKITGSRLLWARTLAQPSPRRLRERIRNQTIREVGRRGKYLVIHLSPDTLLVHLRMSGSLVVEPETEALSPYCRLLLRLGSRWRLAFNNPRKFGRVWLTREPNQILDRLGPEPLERAFSAKAFHHRLRAHRRQIKPLLLDQTFLAGLGNIYTDEALYRARIHPLTASDSLSPPQARALWRSIRQVLREAIRYNGTSFDSVYGGGDFLKRLRVYRQTGHPCRVCETPIQRTLVGQRGTHYCPTCQTRRGSRR